MNTDFTSARTDMKATCRYMISLCVVIGALSLLGGAPSLRAQGCCLSVSLECKSVSTNRIKTGSLGFNGSHNIYQTQDELYESIDDQTDTGDCKGAYFNN